MHTHAGKLGVRAIASTPMHKQPGIIESNNLPSRIERGETTISSLCLPGEDHFKWNGRCREHPGKLVKKKPRKTPAQLASQRRLVFGHDWLWGKLQREKIVFLYDTVRTPSASMWLADRDDRSSVTLPMTRWMAVNSHFALNLWARRSFQGTRCYSSKIRTKQSWLRQVQTYFWSAMSKDHTSLAFTQERLYSAEHASACFLDVPTSPCTVEDSASGGHRYLFFCAKEKQNTTSCTLAWHAATPCTNFYPRDFTTLILQRRNIHEEGDCGLNGPLSISLTAHCFCEQHYSLQSLRLSLDSLQSQQLLRVMSALHVACAEIFW